MSKIRYEKVCKYQPIGTDFYKVLQEGKRCYKAVGCFAIVPHKKSDGSTLWTAEFYNTMPIKIPIGAIIYRFIKEENAWIKHRCVKRDAGDGLYRRNNKRGVMKKTSQRDYEKAN